ncbi:aminopeptidase [Philodulcilactobacillus myokoensis]|uniref:Aminopeptidase n=1 Tax=Philodulcilactobacillus myokoensis TaxID=2929573 RepID=A0A9W6AY30_9LACO|nr:C1 family peptidase [Philodulcilactobacillus myokoensis]GLB46082.1 aminopeptidase [Philodulcilactobacillus myokoensis]
MSKDNSELTADELQSLNDDLKKQPQAKVLSRAIMNNGINAVAKNPDAKKLNHTFSVEVKTGKVSNQKHSGRCWLFALLNTLKHQVAKKTNLKDFELSQNYLFFWDKIERANIFYDRMIALAGRPTNDRRVSFYLAMPGGDGGQWAMAAALVQKYGVMPKSAFPETAITNNTTDFDEVMNLKLHRDGLRLRKMVQNHASDDEIVAARKQMLSEVYRITAYSFGVPSKEFDFEYRDDKKKYHLDRHLTPKQFYDKYVGVDLDDYVVATNSPDKKMNQLYSLPSQNNVVGGKGIELLNLPMSTLKKAAIQQLKDGEGVWFGNDVLQQMSRKDGILDAKLYQRAKLFNVKLNMTKAERLAYHEAEVSHAMTFTGVDLIDQKPSKWKVENSWGDKIADKGYFVMTDDWMDNFVYEVVVHKKYLTAAQQKLTEQTPVELKPWDSLE